MSPQDRATKVCLTYLYMYIRIAFSIELRPRVSRSLRSHATIAKSELCAHTSHVLCKHSNGKRASLANLKLTIGSLLACS